MLDEVEAFVRVAEVRSFTGAARALKVPKSTLSRAIVRLEDQVGARLLLRTTRAVHLTEAGQRLFDQVTPLVAGLRDALKTIEGDAEQPEGLLRVTAAPDIGESFLGEILPRFIARCPRVRVEVDLSTRLVNLAEEGFDVAIRASRKLEASTLVARKLGTSEIRLYASPNYLAKAGVPRSEADLAGHTGVAFGRFEDTRIASPRIPARLAAPDFRFLRAILRQGAGIGPLPTFYAAPDLADGKLVPVLPEWSRAAGHLFLVYAGGKHLPKKVAAFRDFVIPAFERLLGKP